MYRPIALLLILGVLSVLPPVTPAAAAPERRTPASGPTTVAITKGQIHLSLQLENTAYPRNALVLATVRLTNHTRHPISTWDCLRSSLGAEVSSPDGMVTYYPPLLPPPGAPWYGCPGGMTGV